MVETRAVSDRLEPQLSFLINENILGKCFRSCSSFINPRISPLTMKSNAPTVPVNHYSDPKPTQYDRTPMMLSHANDWVICAPAAFLGCGSRFSGSLSESNPNSPSPVTTMDQPGSIHKSRQALVMFRKHMERGTGEDLAVIFCRRQACLAGQNFLSHRHNLSITRSQQTACSPWRTMHKLCKGVRITSAAYVFTTSPMKEMHKQHFKQSLTIPSR
ncbi:hypothetical protein Bca4012_102970 [Brassica carinata]